MNNACDGWRFTQIRKCLRDGRRDVGASEPERRGMDGMDEPMGCADGWVDGKGEGGKGGGEALRGGMLTLMELGCGCVKD